MSGLRLPAAAGPAGPGGSLEKLIKIGAFVAMTEPQAREAGLSWLLPQVRESDAALEH